MFDYTLLTEWVKTQDEFPVQFKKNELVLTIEKEKDGYWVLLTEPDSSKMDGVQYHIDKHFKNKAKVQNIIDRISTEY
jgi:hypothetical protein